MSAVAKLKFGENPVEPSFWFKEAPLYHREEYSFEDAHDVGFTTLRNNLMAIIFPKISIDSYCTSCKRETVFTPANRELDWTGEDGRDVIRNGVQYAKFVCTRKTCSSWLFFVFLIESGSKVTKIGQYPSIADLVSPQIRKYLTVLDDGLISDWQRAVGLRAHGIGAGSYVYLRRIIESLVNLAATSALDNGELDGELYRDARWPERIKLLAMHLPDYLVENAQVYGVLSQGVHELTEDECNAYFEVLHTSIEIICEEKLADKIRVAKASAGATALENVRRQLAAKKN